MVKFDLNVLSYLENEDFRVLTAVENGMRNHEIVPVKLVGTLAEVRSGTGKVLRNLCYNRLLSYERGKKFDGYRLTSLGFDYLALRVFRNRDVIDQVGNQIGVGKEASVYIARHSVKDERYALKVHRLGRTSFKTANTKRDYHKSKVSNWLYLSRLAALREFSFMKLLHERGFRIPEPVDNNRHCIVMRWIDGTLLNNISKDDEIDHRRLMEQLLTMILELANKHGVVHGDFNEFNLLIDNQTNEPYLIDFPQMISTDHQLAKEYFERDVQCIVSFFERRFNYTVDEVPTFGEVDLDEQAESIVKSVARDENEMLNRYLEDNLVLSEQFKVKMNLNDENREENGAEGDDREEARSSEKQGDQASDPIDADADDQAGSRMSESINYDENRRSSKNRLGVIDEELVDARNGAVGQSEKSSEGNLETEQSDEDRNLPGNDDYSNKIERLSTFSHSASRFGGSTVASTFAPDQIRCKLRKEKDRKAKKELIKESFKKIKGDSSSVGRQRKANKQNIREDGTIFDWF